MQGWEEGAPQEEQCPQGPGLLLAPVMDYPKASLVPLHSLPEHCPGALTSVYLTGAAKAMSLIPQQAQTEQTAPIELFIF